MKADGYKKFKVKIHKVIEAEPFSVTVDYAPSAAITQLLKYISKEEQLYPIESIDFDDVIYHGDYGHYEGVKDGIEPASVDESIRMFEDFLKVLALLADDEMLGRVAARAARKKDGHLTANRLVRIASTEGMFKNTNFYQVNAKSDKNDGLNIAVSKELNYIIYNPPINEIAAKVLEENKDIVERMGL